MPKISDLPTDTAPDSADIIPFVDVTASRTESVTVANLAASTAFAGQYAPLTGPANYAPLTALYLPGVTGNYVACPDSADPAQVTAIAPPPGRLAIGGIEVGDTGWRNISSLLGGGWTMSGPNFGCGFDE